MIFAVLAAAACAHRFGGGTPAQELRFSTARDVRWETDGPHDLEVVVENAGSSTISIPRPSSSRVHVIVFEPGRHGSMCVAEPEVGGDTAALVELAPRERRALVVTLDDCRLRAGEYRFEASYFVAQTRGTAAERLGPEHGRIVVQRSDALVEEPASPAAVSPPEHADAPPPPPTGARIGNARPPLGRAMSPLGPSSQACVDRELARRGLNAWGDPAATVYPQGPPTPPASVERQRQVLDRYPDIATTCQVPP